MTTSSAVAADSAAQSSSSATRAGAVVSALAPFAVALAHAGTASIWRDDLVVLRAIGRAGWGYSGGVSALLAQGFFFLPLGSAHFRLAVMGAVVLGAAGLAVFALARDLLVRRGAPLLLTDALATIAALTAALSETGQTEGAAAGGSGIALLLSALVLRARPGEALQEPSRAFGLGMLGGALLAESSLAAAALAAGIAFGLAFERPRVTNRGAAPALAGTAFSAALLFSAAWIRQFAVAPALEIGRAMGTLEGAAAMRPIGGAFGRLSADGSLLTGAAALGFAVGMAERRLRGSIAPLIAIAGLHAGSIFLEGKLLAAEDVASLHFMATGAMALGAAVAVHAVAKALLAWRLPMAQGATILLVMTDLTLAVASAEEASFVRERRSWRGAEALTDQALEQLAPHSALLVRSRLAAWRLWAAQLAHGSRPDVLVVPVPGMGDTRLALRLLRAEPALQKALQDIALEGRPGEEALTILADARPVFTELDPAWDRRVYSHFVPERLWLRFAPEPRGPSDRKAAFAKHGLDANTTERYGPSGVDYELDADTGAMLRARLADGAVLAALLGDREEAATLASRTGAIPGGELFAAELTQRLLTTKSGPVDARSLLR